MSPVMLCLLLVFPAALSISGGGALLWLAAKIVRARDVSLSRFVVATALAWLAAMVTNFSTLPLPEDGVGSGLFSLIALVAALLSVMWAFRSGLGRSLLAVLVWGAMGCIVAIPAVLVSRRFEGAGPLSFRWEYAGKTVRAFVGRTGDIVLACGGESSTVRGKHSVASAARVGFGVRGGRAFALMEGRR